MVRRWGFSVGAGLLALAALTLGACVPHPVGPARTEKAYEGKATTTAKGALSDVETVRLAAEAAGRHGIFGPYVSLLVSEAEEGLGKAQSTLGSIQPPDDKADALGDELDQLLTDAIDRVRQLRITVRRGELDEFTAQAAELADVSDRLNRFIDTHS